MLATFEGYGGLMHNEFSPDGERVVTATVDNRVRVLNATTNGQILGKPIITPFAWHVTFSPNSQLIVNSDDVTTQVWDASDRRQVAMLAGRYLAYSADGQDIVTDRGCGIC